MRDTRGVPADPVELLKLAGATTDRERASTDPEVLLAAVRGVKVEPFFENPEDLLAFVKRGDEDDDDDGGFDISNPWEMHEFKGKATSHDGGKKEWDLFDGILDGFFDGFTDITGVSSQQLALGVILMSCVYLHGWSLGRDQASDLCAQGPESCGAVTIVWTMFVSTAKSWVLILFLLIILLTIEVAVIGVLRRSINETALDVAIDLATSIIPGSKPDGFRMLSVKVMFSWLLDPRMLLSILASFASAAAFAAVYSTLLGLKDNVTADDFRACAQNSYAFQIVAFVAFIVAQFWLKTWWLDTGA